MRTLLLLLALSACRHHDDTKSERDRKRNEVVTRDTPVATTRAAAQPAAPEDTTVYKVPVGSSPVLGKKTALVTIVEFGDFQCPYCMRAEKTMTTLRAQYGDDLRLVWKNSPLRNHPRALPAAELAMDAFDQKKDFWAVKDDLYAALSQSDQSDAALARIASSRGVKMTKPHHKAIDDDQALASSLGIDSTPIFYINGRKIAGAQDVDKFKKLIDSQLAFARGSVANGVKPEAVYDDIMASAH